MYVGAGRGRRSSRTRVGAWVRALGFPILAALAGAALWGVLGLPKWIGFPLVLGAMAIGVAYGYWSATRYEGTTIPPKEFVRNAALLVAGFALLTTAITAIDSLYDWLVPDGPKRVVHVVWPVVAIISWSVIIYRHGIRPAWRRRHPHG